MLRTIALSAGATALLLAMPVAAPAFAHHPSGAGSAGGAGPIVTVPATTLEKGHSSAAVVFEYLEFKSLSDAFLKNNNHVHSLDAIMSPSLLFSYGVTDDLTFTLRLPFVRRVNVREGHVHGNPPGEVLELGDSAGVGDLSLLAQYRLLNSRATQTEIALLLGLSLPTGDTSVDTADTSHPGRFEAEFQPGSGAWEGSVGLALTKRFGAWSFDTNVLYTLVTEGTQDTDLGDRFQYNVALSYRLTGALSGPAGLPAPMYHGGPKGHRGHKHAHEEVAPPKGPALDLVLELNGEWHERQKVAGATDPNSGGNVVFLSPGVRLSHDKWSGFLSFGVPVVSELNGLQAEPGWRVLTGMSIDF
jgi:hypothetical protein